MCTFATNELLAILRKAGVTCLPRDRRTLLHTPRSVTDVVALCGGTFKYYGLESGLCDYLKEHPEVARLQDNLLFSVSIDGLPLHKSTKAEFWPILCKVASAHGDPFMVGLYHGFHKPTHVNEYLHDFLEEYERLHVDGIQFNGKRYNVNLMCWICDAPARAVIQYSSL